MERVHFSYIDPYGHLNASRYLEFFLNHRVEAVDEKLQCSTMDIVKTLGIGFVIFDVHLKYLSPALMGDTLEIASWVSDINDTGFILSTVISLKETRKVKVAGKVEFKAVNVTDGRLTKMPESLPTRSAEDLILKLPVASEYVSTIRGIPVGLV